MSQNNFCDSQKFYSAHFNKYIYIFKTLIYLRMKIIIPLTIYTIYNKLAQNPLSALRTKEFWCDVSNQRKLYGEVTDTHFDTLDFLLYNYHKSPLNKVGDLIVQCWCFVVCFFGRGKWKLLSDNRSQNPLLIGSKNLYSKKILRVTIKS